MNQYPHPWAAEQIGPYTIADFMPQHLCMFRPPFVIFVNFLAKKQSSRGVLSRKLFVISITLGLHEQRGIDLHCMFLFIPGRRATGRGVCLNSLLEATNDRFAK